MTGTPDPERAAIFRALNGLGDMLCIVPALRALRTACPQVRVDLIGLPQARWFAHRFSQYIDQLVDFPGWPGLPERDFSASSIPTFLSGMQAERYDLAADVHGNGSVTNAIVTLFAAQRTAGFYQTGQWRPDGEGFLPHVEHESEVRRYLRLMAHLGAPSQGEELEFPLTEQDRLEFGALSDIHGLRLDDYVCIHPGASTPARRWGAEHFATVADRLAGQGYQVVLTGSDAESRLTQLVAGAMRQSTIDLAGHTSLGALAVLIRGARLLISNDTGVAHLATALRVPSVVIFITNDPLTVSHPLRWAPLDVSKHRTIHEHGPQEPCHQDGREAHR